MSAWQCLIPPHFLWLVAFACIANARVADDVSEPVAGYLKRGELAAAEKFLQDTLAEQPQHHQALFALGAVRVFAAVEKFGQAQYRHGALTTRRFLSLPILRLKIPANPQPEEISYPHFRQIIADFQADLLSAEVELARVDLQETVKLRIDLGQIQLDLTGDGKSDPAENLWYILQATWRGVADPPAQEFPVNFDTGDVPWLRGYCHFLAGLCDVFLAYDHQQFFDVVGHSIYPRTLTSEPRLESLENAGEANRWERDIADLIAAIHLVNFKVREPERMESARQHFLAMIRTSRESWKLIKAETDDDQEWLPNPQQTGVLRIPVSLQVIDGWQAVLTEMEDVLEGRKLIPFWRDYAGSIWMGRRGVKVPERGRGLNLKRFFAEPTDFDLVLFVQGTAALPFLEQGQLSRPETWRNFQQLFGGQFFGLAFWFN